MTLKDLKQKLNIVIQQESYSEKAIQSRSLLEDCLDYIYDKSSANKPKQASLLELIDGHIVTFYVGDQEIIKSLHYVRIIGVNAEHGQTIRKKQAELAKDNIAFFVGFIEAKDNGTTAKYVKPHYMTEAETRRLYIDQYLREAGWEILEKEHVASPEKAGIEIEVKGMPNDKGKGFCDYVLYGKNGKPIAIVEAKKTSVDPEVGRHQVDLYAECIESEIGYKPIMYYTNGYIIKIIDGIYPEREVRAFHSIDELELMLQHRNRGDITDLKVNENITNRGYQIRAITSICEWLNTKHRRGLLVMATGTGKTRVAISIVDILTRNKWIKNVLFLADRTSLVNQAKRNFNKLLPDMSICELSGSGEKDLNARLMFCTYQTMINYIDAEDKVFTSGRLILVS